ncbi:MAG: DUF4126 domain-containing protein [Spirulinaceae cyanobacterium SM2_1_0]|nr:DUF4126 domain-containing protein [Spirulinaceae cyanobacterium SM2_1_0]
MLVALLAVLSASAAAGMRIALPLLAIGLLQSDRLWNDIPLLAAIPPRVVLGVLTSWSLFELFGSKQLLGQRTLQILQLTLSPLVGALMAIATLKIIHVEFEPIWLIAVVGGLLALVLALVQVGWFFRQRGLPLWVALGEDVLCIFLVFFAFNAPQQGGLIAMLLLWLAARSSNAWYRWYRQRDQEPTRPISR